MLSNITFCVCVAELQWSGSPDRSDWSNL